MKRDQLRKADGGKWKAVRDQRKVNLDKKIKAAAGQVYGGESRPPAGPSRLDVFYRNRSLKMFETNTPDMGVLTRGIHLRTLAQNGNTRA